MKITIYSDFVCPYCFLAIGPLEQVAREYNLELDWRAFELRPDPVPTLKPRGAYLINTWRDSVYPLASQLGIPIQLPPVQPRSRLAFEGAEFARDQGRLHEYNTAVYAAFFQDGKNIGEPDVLAQIAESVALDVSEFRGALADHRYLPHVLQQEAEGQARGVEGVPTLFIGTQRLFGYVPYEVLQAVVKEQRAQGVAV
jgi:predicted DsbA family dithiol-disulfide isomerase